MTGHEDKTMSELIDEIRSRTTAFVLVSMREAHGDTSQSLYNLSYGGGVAAAVGLAHYAQASFETLNAQMAERWVEDRTKD